MNTALRISTLAPGFSERSTSLLGGQIVAGSLSTAGFAAQVKAGKMRVVASYQEDRFDMARDVPTLEEMGYGLRATSIQFVYGPKGVPPAVANRVIGDFAKATRSRLFVGVAMNNDLYDKDLLTRDALNAYLLKDRATNRVLIEKLGMKKQ